MQAVSHAIRRVKPSASADELRASLHQAAADEMKYLGIGDVIGPKVLHRLIEATVTSIRTMQGSDGELPPPDIGCNAQPPLTIRTEAVTGAVDHILVEDLNRLSHGRASGGPISDIGAVGSHRGTGSLFLFSTIFASAANQLSRKDENPVSVLKVRAIVQREAERMGASRYVRNLLLEEGVHLLTKHFCDADELKDDRVHPFWSKPDQVWMVVRYADGSNLEAGLQPLDKAREQYRNEEFDIVVDEVAGSILFQKDGCKQTHVLETTARSQTGMLWLILTDDDGFIDHDDIRNLFGLNRDESRNRIHSYPYQLWKKLIGENLRDRILKEGGNHKYPIADKGWSFLWILCDKDPTRSRLIAGIP